MPITRSRDMLASGARDRQVTIQQSTDSPGGSFPKPVWSDLMTAWMSRRELRADERFAANQESAFSESLWTMPYHADMDPEAVDVPKKRRLRYLGRTYNIRGATLLDNRMGIELVTLAQASV